MISLKPSLSPDWSCTTASSNCVKILYLSSSASFSACSACFHCRTPCLFLISRSLLAFAACSAPERAYLLRLIAWESSVAARASPWRHSLSWATGPSCIMTFSGQALSHPWLSSLSELESSHQWLAPRNLFWRRRTDWRGLWLCTTMAWTLLSLSSVGDLLLSWMRLLIFLKSWSSSACFPMFILL